MKTTIVFLVFTLTATVLSPALTGDEERALTEFKAYSSIRAKEIMDAWPTSPVKSLGQQLDWKPGDIGGRFPFDGRRLSGFQGHSIDVRKTDSLVTPYVGFLTLTADFIESHVIVDGLRVHCERKSAAECISGTPSLSKLPHGSSAFRRSYRYTYKYLYQDDTWVPSGEAPIETRASNEEEGRNPLGIEYVKFSLGLIPNLPGEGGAETPQAVEE